MQILTKIIFIGDGRSYHVVDWYRTVEKLLAKKSVTCSFFTDLIASEGHKKLISKNSDDPLISLDGLLFSKQSIISDKLRNIIKFLFIIPQVYRLKKFVNQRSEDNILFHAHSFYYILLCALSGVKYIATPMGSDYLIKPVQSKFYFYMAKFSLLKSHSVTVDSILLKNKIFQLFNFRNVQIVQNGIDTAEISKLCSEFYGSKRDRFLSIRGLIDLYQLIPFLEVRNALKLPIPIDLVYPFKHSEYELKLVDHLAKEDRNIGRVDKRELYHMMYNSFAVISVPYSDSSPRSVYEAIFCGAIVIVTNLEWIEMLTPNMRARIIIIDEINIGNLKYALEQIALKINDKFTPTVEDILRFDQYEQMNFLIDNVYLDYRRLP